MVNVITRDSNNAPVISAANDPPTLKVVTRVSSEANFDFLEITLNDGTTTETIFSDSGDSGAWQTVLKELPGAGSYTLTARFFTDSEQTAGSNQGWIDLLSVKSTFQSYFEYDDFSGGLPTGFTTSGDANWASATFDSRSTLASGTIGNSQESILTWNFTI